MNAREITSRTIAWRAALAAAVLMAVGLAPEALAAQARAASDERAIAAFLSTLRRGVANHDPAMVARVVQFPITVNALVAIPVRYADDFVRYYDAFFTDDLRLAVACGPVQRSPAGLTIHKQLFAERRGSAFTITRMTARPMPPKKAPAPRMPQRVVFRTTHRLAPFAGTLEHGAVHSYVIWVRKNEVLRATLTGFTGKRASMRIVNERGQPIDPKAADAARTWTAPVPETGDYRIDVVRRAGQGEPPVVYDLAITLR